MMKMIKLRSGTKGLLTLALLMVLILAGCSNPPENAGASGTTSPASNSIDASNESPVTGSGPTIQIADVFDTESHKDKLSIRYFFLDSEEKSGDAILLQTPDGFNIMIDSGIPATRDQLEAYMDKLGVTRIDYAINTHPHYDHMGGYTSLLKTMKIGGFYMPNLAHTTETYRTVMNLIEQQQIPLHYIEDGDELHIGEHVRIELLNPEKGTSPDKYEAWSTENLNNHSLVLKVYYGEKIFLFAGDLYKSGEYDLVERHEAVLDADLVHAPHHGDKTSSSPAFVKATSPEIAVLSANIFQNLDVKQRYEKNGATTVSTALNGNILLLSDGKTIEVIVEKEVKK
ncbi:MBL fold metallo-hydrolase [Paenibacillus sp. JCM 10914]|uniref:ComEC/Rec2 family competence protein n=1 Tax=Paenibacillus sp. JCM 10914 TaxID=1236974 RepID=UPI0003CC604E|nr:MBL fold metallo-hydrolase [Paenibacillus sp. JCM 10914]GAE05920.1 beta-lactamase domain protein [Paenibacillus sp. JCM 10914]